MKIRLWLVAAVLAATVPTIAMAFDSARGRTVLFAPGPEVAAGKAQEHGAAAGLHALALQGEEDFLDGIAHGRTA